MSYAAEPYAQFVDDLLTALTGGVIRQQFRFLKGQARFRPAAPGPLIPSTVKVSGQANGAYRRFRPRIDYEFKPDNTIEWRESKEGGQPAADAVWPDEGTVFYVNFEYEGASPLLTDRNPGSVTRLLAESFAREYAVMSGQLQAVYRAGFLDTAGGRDLDQLVRLLGLSRRRTTSAAGTVVFARSTPAPADIFIPSGTKLSTAQPPPVMFETVRPATLLRGSLSAEVGIQAISEGASGVVAADAVRTIHRPILGIETVTNPQPTQFIAETESDDALRERARRALEGAGQATTGALFSALMTLNGVREKDVRLAEDPLAHPGVVELTLALPPMSDEERQDAAEQAVELIEQTRPVGVRITHNIGAPRPIGAATPGSGIVAPEGAAPAAIGVPAGMFLPVDVIARLAPTSLALTPQQRAELARQGDKTIRDFFGEAGIGEILVYNKLIASLMAIDGVLDLSLEMFPQADAGQPHHKNVVPDNPTVKAVPGSIDVDVGGALVMLTVRVTITLKGAGLLGDPATSREAARGRIEQQLKEKLKVPSVASIDVMALKSMVGDNTFDVTSLHYNVEYVDAGVRISQQDLSIALTGLEQIWVRSVVLADGVAA